MKVAIDLRFCTFFLCFFKERKKKKGIEMKEDLKSMKMVVCAKLNIEVCILLIFHIFFFK